MARPSKQEKRDQQLNIKLTLREQAWLVRRAQGCGLRLVDYGRHVLLADRPIKRRAQETHLDPLFLAHLSRIGNNLNQIARRLHQRSLPLPAELGDVLRKIREIIGKASSDGA